MAKVKLENVRIAFCQNLFVKGGKYDRFDARFVIPPKHPAVKLLDDAIEAAAKEKWAAKAPAVLAKLIKDGDCTFKKEDYTSSDGEVYDGFEGMFSIGAHNKVKPLVIDRDKTQLSPEDGRPYAGCYVNATIDIWCQDSKEWGRKINASLTGVQFLRDGDAFTGGQPADPDDFDDLAETGETEDSLVD